VGIVNGLTGVIGVMGSIGAMGVIGAMGTGAMCGNPLPKPEFEFCANAYPASDKPLATAIVNLVLSFVTLL
jgi:hypothetical protein